MNATTGQLTAIQNALALLPEKDRALPPAIAAALELGQAIKAQPAAPGVHAIAQRIAYLDDPATLDDLLDHLAEEKRRGDVLAAAQAGGISGQLQQRMSEDVASSIDEVLRRLQPAFDAAAKDLAVAAPKLPAGEAALDAQAVLDSDTGSAYRKAADALATIGTIAAAVPVDLRRNGSTPPGSQIVAVVDTPKAGPFKWNGMSDGKHLGSDEEGSRIKAVRHS